MDCLQLQNCEISGLTLKQSFHESDELQWKDMCIYRAAAVLYRPKPIQGICDFLYAVKNKLCSYVVKKTGNPLFREPVVKALVRSMRKLPMDEYDVVIVVCAYYDAAEALLRYRNQYGLRAKTALYQVDPLAENKIYIQDNETQLQRYEQELYRTMDHVFTTPIIYKEKEKLGWDMSAVTALEFPLSFDSKPRQRRQPDDEIRCVYAGYLYGRLRDAGFTLDLFSRLDDPRIQLYIVGKGQEELLRAYQNGALKGRLHVLGEKGTVECDAILASADVLVNIGNTVNNQVPSKLFHYISFGRPILNITACEDCPTLPYMKKYPLSLTVADTQVADTKTAEAVQSWLQENCRKGIATTDILQLFADCTPAFIASKMLTKIEGRESYR